MNRYSILFIFFLTTNSFSQKLSYEQLFNKYNLLYGEWKYDEALIVAKQMNAWTLKNETDTSLRYAESFNRIAKCFINSFKSDSANYYLKLSLITLEKQHRKEHFEYSVSLANLGYLNLNLGDFSAAELFYKQSLENRKKSVGEFSYHYGFSLRDIGDLYEKIGDYKLALSYYNKSLNVLKIALGENHRSYANILVALGILYINIEDYKAAEIILNQSLEIKRNTVGESHFEYGVVLTHLANLYNKMGENDFAEMYYLTGILIIEKKLGNTPKIAYTYSRLGKLYKEMGNYTLADKYIKQSLDKLKKFLGEDHPDYINTYSEYADLLIKTNKEKEAYRILQTIFLKKEKQVIANFEWLNQNQQEAFWQREKYFFDNLFWLANKMHEKIPDILCLNYNAALVTKSKMMQTKLTTDNFEQERDELKEQLQYRNRLLIKLESDGTSENEKIEQLRKEIDSLDNRLTMSWPEYAQLKKNLSITWEQVQQNLEIGEAAIEFVRFKNEDDSLYYYNALIIRKEDKYPQLIKLCKEKDLENFEPKLGFSPYYSLVWQPMEYFLKDVRTIYYAPIGLLNNIPFNAMYSNNQQSNAIVLTNESFRGSKPNNGQIKTPKNVIYLMDKYKLHQLTSTRYLAMGLKQKENEQINKTIAMVGGVNYDFLTGTIKNSKKSKKDLNLNRSSSSAQQKLIYLEGTKFEVEEINKKIKPNGWISTVLESNQATEENIIKLEGKEAKGILHIATHGYAFPEYDFNDTLIDKNSLQYSYRYSTNPMVRSGLILAGGNWAWTGSDTLSKLGAEQNGILTALEVSQLNLKKTKLVVLSACETGLGKIEGSEGTFGLKRGFKLAGVEQIIVSLWSVPDKETMELMTLFYSDLTKTLNPVVSFEKAQKEMRIKYPTEPEKWAGFVLVR